MHSATFGISEPLGVYRKVSGVMGRSTSVESAGLDVVLTNAPNGWHAEVTNDGRTVFNKGGYKSQASARSGVSYWFQHHYRKEMLRAERTPPTATDGSAAALGRSIRDKANAAESESVTLRLRADKLEADAKRMHAAADLLEDPDGDQG
jgi:hypothetical protein